MVVLEDRHVLLVGRDGYDDVGCRRNRRVSRGRVDAQPHGFSRKHPEMVAHPMSMKGET